MEVHAFEPGHAEQAARLFHPAWGEERKRFPLLPEKLTMEKNVAEILRTSADRPGVVAFKTGK
jgi:hypothetical protein